MNNGLEEKKEEYRLTDSRYSTVFLFCVLLLTVIVSGLSVVCSIFLDIVGVDHDVFAVTFVVILAVNFVLGAILLTSVSFIDVLIEKYHPEEIEE